MALCEENGDGRDARVPSAPVFIFESGNMPTGAANNVKMRGGDDCHAASVTIIYSVLLCVFCGEAIFRTTAHVEATGAAKVAQGVVRHPQYALLRGKLRRLRHAIIMVRQSQVESLVPKSVNRMRRCCLCQADDTRRN